jgi:hypothetical protein
VALSRRKVDVPPARDRPYPPDSAISKRFQAGGSAAADPVNPVVADDSVVKDDLVDSVIKDDLVVVDVADVADVAHHTAAINASADLFIATF